MVPLPVRPLPQKHRVLDGVKEPLHAPLSALVLVIAELTESAMDEVWPVHQ